MDSNFGEWLKTTKLIIVGIKKNRKIKPENNACVWYVPF